MSGEAYKASVDFTDPEGNRVEVEVHVTLTESPNVHEVEEAMQRCVGAIMWQMTGDKDRS